MRHLKYLLPLLALLVTACQKDPVPSYASKSFTFNGTLEQMESPSDAKIILYNEEWIFWELGDRVSIASNLTDGTTVAGDLVNSSPGTDFEDFDGIFVVPLPDGSKYFLGLHPYNENNSATGSGRENSSAFSRIRLHLVDTQFVRPFNDPTQDTTFRRDVLPMVAWYGGTWDGDHPTPFNLDFHNLAAIVRVQIFNSTSTTETLKSLTFTCDNGHNLSGAFTVNNYNTEEPYLSGGTSNKVVVAFADGDPNATFAPNSLKTFYLILPAFGGRSVTTTFHLNMDVATADNKHCTKGFTVKTRRTGITYMRALGIDNWDNNSAYQGLSGNGTERRPFKIYSLNDLTYLRSCYNDSVPGTRRTINGQPINANTHIRLMRSDIVLTTSNWEGPILNFLGHFDAVAATSQPGITNNSHYPLFSEILEGSLVEGITLKTDAHFTTYGTGKSPFCYTNSGRIKDCIVTNDPDAVAGTCISDWDNLAGIAATNTATGVIEGCRCQARLSATNGYGVAGICLNNSGTIKGCQATAPMAVTASEGTYSRAAGICLNNLAGATVQDSYFSAMISSSTSHWGGIVYDNNGTVDNCYFGSGIIITSGQVGGIVHTNSDASARVNYCRINGSITAVRAGGIVDSLQAGKVINCYANAGGAQVILSDVTGTQRIGGGLVAVMTGGSLENSFARYVSVLHHDAATDIVGGLIGTASGGAVENCYAYVLSTNNFYGTSTLATTSYTRCYTVAGSSQTGITPVSATDAQAASGTGALVVLLNATGKPAGAYDWTLNQTPTLTAPSSNKRRATK